MTIYFIGNGSEVKIGYTASNDAKSRIKSLQVGSPKKLSVLGLMHGGENKERELHAEFSDLRLEG